MTCAAGGIGVELQCGGDSIDRVEEVERELSLHVAAPLGSGALRAATAAATIEQVADEVADVEVERAAAGTPGGTAETTGHRPEPTRLVVVLALGGITDHVVGRRDLLEALLRGWITLVGVRMMLSGQFAVGLRDLLLRSGVGHAQHLVIVLLVPLALSCHVTSPRLPATRGPSPSPLVTPFLASDTPCEKPRSRWALPGPRPRPVREPLLHAQRDRTVGPDSRSLRGRPSVERR